MDEAETASCLCVCVCVCVRGRGQAGEIVFEDLRIPAEARRAVAPVPRIIQPPRLEMRRREIHKREAGRVLVTRGVTGNIGAALLVGEAASPYCWDLVPMPAT